MWQYEKKLQYPVHIATPNPKIAQLVISQFGGLDGKKIHTKTPRTFGALFLFLCLIFFVNKLCK